jgi:general stress protein YciG
VPWPHWKNTQWYTKKIAQGGHKYDTRLQGKRQRLDRIAEELGVFQQELSHTRSILAQLDTLLRPGGSLVLDGIIGSVESNKSALEEAGRKGGQAPELEAGQGAGEIFAFEDSEVVRDKDLVASADEMDPTAKAADD